MAYKPLKEASINANLNTGNISTDDFLAIFSSTSPTDVAGGGPGGGGGGNSSTAISNYNYTVATSTLNPPLLTVDGQYTAANFSSIQSSNTLMDLFSGGHSNSNSNGSNSRPNRMDGVITFSNSTIATFNETLLLLSNGSNISSSNGVLGGVEDVSFNDSFINWLTPSTAYANTNSNTNTNNHNNSFPNINTTNTNETEFLTYAGRYPSGYTLTHIVFASIIVTILMIIIVVGNMLVIIAIATEKSLKNIQNWFIASLAVADFFLGLIIMPFSLANELMGYWIFGSWWCDIHSAMDVLLCTASIMNLCLISLDRYWSITKAVEYLKSRTPARAAFMIAAVWIMSALICIPPLLGWKVKMPEGPLPKCALSEDIGYVLYSALGSFYIPSCIMVFVYIRIYFAAKARARRGIKKHPRKANNEQVTSFTTQKGSIPLPSSSAGSAAAVAALRQHQQHQIATIETPPNSSSLPIQIPTVTCDLASDISTSEAVEIEPQTLIYSNGSSGGVPTVAGTLSPAANSKETLKVSTIATTHNALRAADAATTAALLTPHASIISNANGCPDCPITATSMVPSTTPATTAAATASTLSATIICSNTSSNELRVSPLAGRCRALSVGIDTDMVSEFDPSSSDSGVVSRCAVVKPLKFRLCQPIFGRKSSSQQRRNESKAAAATTAANARLLKSSEVAQCANELEPALPKVQKPRDPEKEKRRIARKKEKRATLILGLIMGSFIACWLPFFFLYILLPACSTHCHIPDSAFAIAFWLGYMNSALNPAIYTIFNKDFRRAFRRILFK